MKRVVVVLIITLVICNLSFAKGPFGISYGDKLSTIETIDPDVHSKNWFVLGLSESSRSEYGLQFDHVNVYYDDNFGSYNMEAIIDLSDTFNFSNKFAQFITAISKTLGEPDWKGYTGLASNMHNDSKIISDFLSDKGAWAALWNNVPYEGCESIEALIKVESKDRVYFYLSFFYERGIEIYQKSLEKMAELKQSNSSLWGIRAGADYNELFSLGFNLKHINSSSYEITPITKIPFFDYISIDFNSAGKVYRINAKDVVNSKNIEDAFLMEIRLVKQYIDSLFGRGQTLIHIPYIKNLNDKKNFIDGYRDNKEHRTTFWSVIHGHALPKGYDYAYLDFIIFDTFIGISLNCGQFDE